MHERKMKMENKKTKVAIVVVIILIIALIAISYFYNDFNNRQMVVLTEEASKILEIDLIESNINLEIKTEKDYAKVEKAMKEYISNLKNIYVKTEELVSEINPNFIFSAQNMQDEDLKDIDNIINGYKEKCQNIITEYEALATEEKIVENINQVDFSMRKSYFVNLYNDVMLSEAMKSKYNDLEEEIKNEKAELYDKLNKIDKIKTFLIEHKDSWTVKEDKIQFTNLNRMAEFYNLLNQIID